MDKNTMIKVTNRDNGKVGYMVPELGIRRSFMPKETKEVTFEELERLSYLEGGLNMLKNFLVVQDKQAMKSLLNEVEPEYFYTEEDVKRLLTVGSLDEFLDCLDFAPDGVLDIIKELSVSLPLNDMAKREAILEKLNFNVTSAIRVQNTKFDSETEQVEESEKPKRRVAVETQEEEKTTTRRAAAPKYKVISE